MASKRPAPVGSDSDGESEHTQASKRARTADDSDDGGASPVPATQRSVKDKGRGHEVDVEENDEIEVENATPDEDEEKRFEEENEDFLLARIKNRTKVQGGVAEMGVIEKLEMHQFMCHKYLTFNFGPQINFIIGHNGSGKSAVLSALTVALGGKANTTGRGSGLKAFIREGQSVAEVSVTIKNQGDEAYRHEDYGDSIVVTRRFTKEGSSSYKIKAKGGHVVSTKREELSAICDHMNIQVDNPMNILTQDSARQFLSASQPGDKYKFFLQGTQLSQLSTEYSTCLHNITFTEKVLAHKQDATKDLEDALKEATSRFKEAAKARDQRHKADELKKEMAWAYVLEKQQELEKKYEVHAKQQRLLAKAQNELDKAEAECTQASKAVEAFNQELVDLGEMKHLEEQKRDVTSKLRENKHHITELKDEEKSMNSNMQGANKAITEMTSRIEEEQRKAALSTQGKRDQINQRLQQAEADLDIAQKQLDTIKSQLVTARVESDMYKEKGPAAEKELGNIKDAIDSADNRLSGCDVMEKDKLAPFGRQMDKVLESIAHATWKGEKPIGPFGKYVTLKDRGRWAELLRSQLGSLMSGFAVTDARDRKPLAEILKRHGNPNINITITGVDLFDYSRGEPPPEFLTVLRALEFTNPFVLRIFINQAKIESVLLAETRREGDDKLLQLGRGGICWSADFYRVQRYPDGGAASTLLHKVGTNDPRNQLFTGDNIEDTRRRWRAEIEKLTPTFNQKKEELRVLRKQFDANAKDVADLESKQKRALQDIRKLQTARDDLREELNDELPVNIQALQEELKRHEEEKDSIMKQFAELQLRKGKIDEAQKPLMQELEKIKKGIDAYEDSRTEITEKLSGAAGSRLKAQTHQKHYAAKLTEVKTKVEDAEANVKVAEEEFEAWTKQAAEYCERFENPRDPVVVQRALVAVEKALKEREKRNGASVDDMAEEVNKKKQALDTAMKELKDLKVLNRALKQAIKMRLTRWHEFRRHIALRCKVYFSYHLSKRGYYGKVMFDHVNGTLHLKVQTDDQTATQGGSREKDPRSLSGGEKSFSTICLLLSLWESIGCPIRCLDEFDVFMDAVNRRISMKMMIDTANASNRKQYILITPQDMTSVHAGNSVRVHRMTDPERGQGVLAFQ